MIFEGVGFIAFICVTFGFWLGCGAAPAILVWLKNPKESTLWKVWASVYSLALGPIGFATMKHWLED
ncbi:hypothetical protein [Vibrio vulnificus]|uniref:hypothetical protein n=1 Tax=Vibrio vulnificus TaxID=672 RepID=UPI0032422C88